MDWRLILQLCSRNIMFSSLDGLSFSLCAWTTFSRLKENVGYWSAPLPREDELLEFGTSDGGSWGQPFPYNDLAHLIIPRFFIHEINILGDFNILEIEQKIDNLSVELNSEKISHNISEYALDIKLY